MLLRYSACPRGTYSDEDLGHLPPAPPSSASDPPRQEEGSPVRLDECGELTVRCQ